MALITSLSGAVESDDMHMGVVLPVEEQLHLQLPFCFYHGNRSMLNCR